MGVRIAPSILSADFVNLEQDIARVAAADLLHVDVMDNHFVPNLTIGLPVVKRVATVSPIPLDVHLMIENPDHWAPLYAAAGVMSVTFHWEAAADPVAIARQLRAADVRAAVALKPGTPASVVTELVREFDMILVMTVEPGFGGQKFMADMLPKITALRTAITDAGANTWIQVDGGVSRDTIALVAAAGADTFVAGSAIYGAADVAGEISVLRDLARAAKS